MHDEEFHPFVPADWRTESLMVPRFQDSLRLISPLGTRLVAAPSCRDYLDLGDQDVWVIYEESPLTLVGTIARNARRSKENSLLDLHQALQLGETLPDLCRPLERLLLSKNMLGGTWFFDETTFTLNDGVRSIPFPLRFRNFLRSLWPVSRLDRVQGQHLILSGPAAVQITLPETRHAMMERLAALTAPEAAHA